jgi:importin subunit beta-1
MIADPAVRSQVESWLKQQENTNFPGYVRALVIELGTAERSGDVRQAAGLALKNTMVSRDDQAAKLLAERWKAVPLAQRQEVKALLLQILRDPSKQVRSTATLVSRHKDTLLPHSVSPFFSMS